MKLYYSKTAKDPIYYVQVGIRQGKKVTTKNIKRIGKHSELLLSHDDPLAYAKSVVSQMNNELKSNQATFDVKVDFNEKLPAPTCAVSHSQSANIGYFFLQSIYHDLKLSDFFIDIASTRKVTFDLNLINRFLTFDRILEPRSKLSTFHHLDFYFEKPDFQYQHILRFMSILAENYDDYIKHLFIHSNHIVSRNTSVCYFDCTNYYFEIEDEDDDYVDEVTGEIIKGFRKYGPAKDHKPNPLVQMGLFMDGQGIPITMCLKPGSDNEQKCAIPTEKKMLEMFENKKVIYCADAGLGSIDIRNFNSKGQRAFIITQSIKKLSDTLKTAVFNDCDYRLLSSDESVSIKDMHDFDRFDSKNLSLYNDTAYKIIEADKLIDLGLYEEQTLKNGKTKKVKSKGTLKQKIIITFDRKAMEYQRHIRNGQIERAKRLVKNGTVEDVKKGPHDVTRFIKRTSKEEKDGKEVIDIYEIDQDVIDNEEKYDGFYAVATNLDDDARAILKINAQRYKIEDCFRTLKTYFDARPVNHRLTDRITAHFMICYTALLIFRLLEVKLNGSTEEHYTTEQILETLKNMNVFNQQDLYYQSLYTGSHICTALNAVFPLGLDKKNYLAKDMKKKLKKIS